MVRKRLKKPPQGQATEERPLELNLTPVVFRWLEGLRLKLGEGSLPPPQSPTMGLFTFLCVSDHSGSRGPHPQVQGLRKLREKVLSVVSQHLHSDGDKGRKDLVDELRLVYISGLLLYLDPDTGVLRKVIKSLLTTTEEAAASLGGGTVDAVHLVLNSFVARALEFLNRVAQAVPDGSAPCGAREMTSSISSSCIWRDEEGSTGTMKIVASLQGLLDVFAARHRHAGGDEDRRRVVFSLSMELLGALLEEQGPLVELWCYLYNIEENNVQGDHFRERHIELECQPMLDNAAGTAGVSPAASIDCCREILKTASFVISLYKDWKMMHLPGGKAMALGMSKVCLQLLSDPRTPREVLTHASCVLVHMAMASWKHCGLWPEGGSYTGDSLDTDPAASVTPAASATSVASVTSENPGGDDIRGSESSNHSRDHPSALAVLAALLMGYRIPQRYGRGQSRDEMSILLMSFMPFPSNPTLALCRTLIHAASTSILLSFWGSDAPSAEGGHVGVCLFAGPILRVIVRRCGGAGSLQLRFHALQVLHAWLCRAKELATRGLILFHLSHGQRSISDEVASGTAPTGVMEESALQEVMDLIMAALVHPSRLISGTAPELLQHAVQLRQSFREQSRTMAMTMATVADSLEWEKVVRRVLQERESSRGKYVALGVLLPRIGVKKMLELCPSLVQELVWAVGDRGNASGHAMSVLLQVLTDLRDQGQVRVEGRFKNPSSKRLTLEYVKDSKDAKDMKKGDHALHQDERADSTHESDGKEGEESDVDKSMLHWRCWITPAVAALMQECSSSRVNVAAYLLPEVLKFDPSCVLELFAKLRAKRRVAKVASKPPQDACGLDSQETMDIDMRYMWAMIEVARHARKAGVAAGVTIVSCGANSGLLHLNEVKAAALHVDETVRMAAISLLCTDVRLTTMPSAAEVSLLRQVLPYNLKIHGAQNRQVLLRSLQILLSRMRETTRSCTKRLALAAAATSSSVKSEIPNVAVRNNGSGEVESQAGRGNRLVASGTGIGTGAATGIGIGTERNGLLRGSKDYRPPDPRELMSRVEMLARFLCEVVLSSLYPGSPFERQILGLEIADLVIPELVCGGSRKNETEEACAEPLKMVVSAAVFNRHWVDTLLMLLGSGWERIRTLSYSLLARFPKPLPGYHGSEGAKELAKEGLRLTGSARQKESDQGALVLRLVFAAYALGLRLNATTFMSEAFESDCEPGALASAACAPSILSEGDTDTNAEMETNPEMDTTNGRANAKAKAAGNGRNTEGIHHHPTFAFLEALLLVLSRRLDCMQLSLDALLGRAVDPCISPRYSQPQQSQSRSLEDTCFPHGVLLTIRHVIQDLARMDMFRRSDEKHGRSGRPGRRTGEPGVPGAPGAPGQSISTGKACILPPARVEANESTEVCEGSISSSISGHELRLLRKTGGLLLERTLRALKLSLGVVGDIASNEGHEHYEGHEKGAFLNQSDGIENPIGDGKDMGARDDAGWKPMTVTAGKRISRSANANAYVGTVSVDCRGHIVLPCSSASVGTDGRRRQPQQADQEGHGGDDQSEDGVKDGAGKDQGGSGLVEDGQRAVVGAWLLAKEACHCLSTMVTAFPLPTGPEAPSGRRTSPEATGTGRTTKHLLADQRTRIDLTQESKTDGESFVPCLLTLEDVRRVGEALLESLLSLKHMGCVASAQTAFQAVCQALLQEGERNPWLSRLPSLWLDKLLGQLTGVKPESVLRRSAGLATAVTAILRGEPRNVVPALLPRGMRHLLSLSKPKPKSATVLPGDGQSVHVHVHAHACNEERGDDWRYTVHSMNVLRLVFIDSTLADDIAPYVTEAIVAAVCGFEDSHWAVRNSSMMLFAAVIQRAIGGGKNARVNEERRPHSPRGAMTGRVFFEQFSELHPFLLKNLARATTDMMEWNSTSLTSLKAAGDGVERSPTQSGCRGLKVEMHPVLYPILLLLARLRREDDVFDMVEIDDVEPTSRLTSTSAFVPYVKRCAGNPHFMARTASARALAALVPLHQAPGVVLELLQSLPTSEREMRSWDKAGGGCCSNHVHGTLLQVLEVLLAVRQYDTGHAPGEQSSVNPEHGRYNTTTSPSGKSPDTNRFSDNMGKEVAPMLLKYVWLTNPGSSTSPPVKYAMLSVLEAMDDILTMKSCSTTFRRKSGNDDGKEDGKEDRRNDQDKAWSVGAELRMKLVEAQDSNLECAIRIGSDGRCLPGYSILVSKVVTAGIERRLKRVLSPPSDAPPGMGGGTGEMERAERASKGAPEHEARRSSSTGIDASLRFVLDLVLDPNVDVRDAAIKAIKKQFGNRGKSYHKPRGSQTHPSNLVEAEAGLPGAALRDVWVAASKALTLIDEVHPPNVRRLLRLLTRVGGCLLRNKALGPAPEITQESAVLWHHVLELCDGGNVGEGDIHAGAIEVLGIMIRLDQGSVMLEEQREKDAGLGHRCSRESSYLARLESASEPAQPLTTRASAAVSLAFSGILRANQLLDINADSEGTDLPRRNPLRLFRMWFVLIRLLQDESEKVRLCATHTLEASGLVTAMEPRGKTITETAGNMEADRSPTMSLGDSTESTPKGDSCQRFRQTASVTSEEMEGRRPVLRTIELVLDHLLSIVENGARDEIELDRQRSAITVAEQLALSLLEALSRIPGIAKDGMVVTAGTATGSGAAIDIGTGFIRGKEQSPSSRMYPEQYSRMGEEYVAGDVYGTGGDETFGGGRGIFERDELVEMEEPLVFAGIAAPYLRRSVEVALEEAKAGGRVLPAALVHAITMALENVSEILERLSHPTLSGVTRVTWTPEVFVSFSASMSTATALLEAFESGADELCDILRKSSARVRLGCKRFATCCREAGVHPDLSRVVYTLLKEDRSSRSYTAEI